MFVVVLYETGEGYGKYDFVSVEFFDIHMVDGDLQAEYDAVLDTGLFDVILFGYEKWFDLGKLVLKNISGVFYTVDFAELEDGTWKVIEAGDGSVSGLSDGQDYAAFFRALYHCFA